MGDDKRGKYTLEKWKSNAESLKLPMQYQTNFV